MTDNEIIKALEEHSEKGWFDFIHSCSWECITNTLNSVVDLINRQKAEIERLQNKVEELAEVLSNSVRIRYAEVKAEAIKEFAERLKDYQDIEGYDAFLDKDIYSSHIKIEIDELYNLVKEMVGEDK